LWIRPGAAGAWNNNGSANPATGVGGAAIGAGVAALYPYFRSAASGEVSTANFGPSGFVGAVPSGFASGFGTSGTIVTSPTVVLTPSGWQWAWRHDTTDPATGAAWTAAAVNTALIGPTVIA